MYPPPVGRDLSEEQARELDDTFLSSDPFEYFRSRIASLLVWRESAPIRREPRPKADPGDIRTEFNQYLQRDAGDAPLKDLDVHAQVAADALAVRQHAAESLLRLACARLAPGPIDGAGCLWAEIATGPTQIGDVIARLNASAEQPDPGERMLSALVPREMVETVRQNPQTVDACNVFVAWLGHATVLLSPGEIDLQAGHTVPLSAFTADDTIDIFDQPVLELLARGPKADGHRQGLEVTQLRLKPSALLAEAYMLAMAHGALFHVASVEHFSGRADLPEDLALPAFPGYPVGGPRPQDIDATAPLGMRFPLTTPPGGGPVKRQAGIGFRHRFQIIHVDYGNRSSGRVVDG